MNFSQKVFINDNPLILTTDKREYIAQYPEADRYMFLKRADKKNFTSAVKELLDADGTGAIIEDKSAEVLLKQLHELYHPIDAGGGVVFNEAGELLMIFRRGKWDLPKGKLDKGENIESCAVREVSEETGLQKLAIEGKVCDTYHIYTQNKEQLVKRTAWYKMKGTSKDKLAPQKEEKILEARWVNKKELASLAAQSYEAVREVMRAAGLKF